MLDFLFAKHGSINHDLDQYHDFTHDGGGTSRDSGNGNHQNHNDLSLINQLDNTCIYSKPIQEAKRMYYTYK